MRTIVIVLLIAGCTDEQTAETARQSHHHGKRISVRTSEPPTVIAYRAEGSSTWLVPAARGPRHHEFFVSGPYRLTVICEDADTGYLAIHQRARTPADDRDHEIACNTRPAPHRVTGSMVQPGSVWLGGLGAFGNTPSWTFDLGANRGKQAIIGLTDDRIAVRHGLHVHGDTTIAPIDVATEGHPLVPVAFTAGNLNGDETEATAIVFLDIDGTGLLLYGDDPATAIVAPNAVLRPRDEQVVTLAVHSPEVGRTITRRYRTGDPTTFPLPTGVLGPVTFDDFAVTWSTLPAFYEEIELSFFAFSLVTFNIIEHRLDATRRWVEATGATGAEIDLATLPGMRDEWEIDLNDQYQRYIEASRTLPNGDVIGSDISQTVNGF